MALTLSEFIQQLQKLEATDSAQWPLLFIGGRNGSNTL